MMKYSIMILQTCIHKAIHQSRKRTLSKLNYVLKQRPTSFTNQKLLPKGFNLGLLKLIHLRSYQKTGQDSYYSKGPFVRGRNSGVGFMVI